MCVNDMIETTIYVLHLHMSMLLHVVTTSHKTLKNHWKNSLLL